MKETTRRTLRAAWIGAVIGLIIGGPVSFHVAPFWLPWLQFALMGALVGVYVDRVLRKDR